MRTPEELDKLQSSCDEMLKGSAILARQMGIPDLAGGFKAALGGTPKVNAPARQNRPGM